MDMATYYISEADLLQLISPREGVTTVAPSPTKGLAWLDATDSPSLEPMTQPRSAQSPKGLFLPPAESVGRYGPQSASATTTVDSGKMVLAGARACDLRARNYLDKVMLAGAFDAPDYAARREAMTIVSCDCVDCTETCCCTLVGGRPYATEGFDVNLTPIDGGYVMEVAGEKGRQWLAEAQTNAPAEATGEQLAKRDEIREAMTKRLREQNAKFTFAADDSSQPSLPNDEDASWQRFAADCVECGACTNICPTCHCFYLYDQVLGAESFERVRTWDSCLLSTYHRMAGTPGVKGTPRPKLLSRLANRVLHKFTYSPQQYGLLGCVGCGRCIDACLGAIDIREVVQELSG